MYTDHQRLELEKEFHYSRYITIRRKAELAATLGLSERQVRPPRSLQAWSLPGGVQWGGLETRPQDPPSSVGRIKQEGGMYVPSRWFLKRLLPPPIVFFFFFLSILGDIGGTRKMAV